MSSKEAQSMATVDTNGVESQTCKELTLPDRANERWNEPGTRRYAFEVSGSPNSLNRALMTDTVTLSACSAI